MALETAALVALAAAGGNFHVPVVAGDAPAGLSGDGRTAVLEEQPASGRSRFAVIEVEQRRLERVVSRSSTPSRHSRASRSASTWTR